MESWSVFHYARALARRWMTTLAVVVGTTSACVLAGLAQTPVYESHSRFYHAGTIAPLGVYSGRGSDLFALRNVMYPLLLQERLYSYRALLESASVRALVHRRVPEKPLAELDDGVVVGTFEDGTLLVRVRDPDPQIAARVAAAYPLALEELLRTASDEVRRRELAAAGDALERARADLDAARAEFTAFLEAQGTPRLELAISQDFFDRASTERDLEVTGILLRSIEQRIRVAEERLRIERPGLRRSALDQRGETESVEPAAGERSDPADPEIAGSREIPPESLQRTLEEGLLAFDLIQAALAAGLDARARAARIQRAENRRLPALLLDAGTLRAELARLEKMVSSAARLHAEMREQMRERPSEMVLLASGRVRSEPVLPAPAHDALLGAILGFLLSLLLVCVLEARVELERGAPTP